MGFVEFKKSNRDKKEQLKFNVSPPEVDMPPRKTPPPTSEKSITINIQFSSATRAMRRAKSVAAKQLNKLTKTQKRVVIGGSCLIVIGSVTAGSFAHQYNLAKESDTLASTGGMLENLEYQTVLPDGKTISDLGGWKRVSPTGSDPVFAYADTLDNVAISVSQQPLPHSFTGNVDSHVAEVAKKFNATTKLDASGTSLYIGASAKGPQSVILSKNNLLILIKSVAKITDDSWQKYATSLN